MSQQITNFAETIKELLYENWTLKNRNDRLKFFWAGYKIDKNIFKNKKRFIEVTTISTAPEPKTLGLTKLDNMFRIDLWIKVQETEAKNHNARVQLENDRALCKDHILSLVHGNQIAISGLEITTFGNMLDPDDLETMGDKWLHSVIHVIGQIHHRKS